MAVVAIGSNSVVAVRWLCGDSAGAAAAAVAGAAAAAVATAVAAAVVASLLLPPPTLPQSSCCIANLHPLCYANALMNLLHFIWEF